MTRKPKNKEILRIIPLGGSEEVGKNCTAFEYNNEIIVLDLGLDFANEETPGIDYILPDINYLKQKKDKIKALIISHGHLDHIGAIPYLINDLGNPPIYGLPLTMGIIKERLVEFNLDKKTKLNVINLDQVLKFKNFKISFFRVNHNISDSMGIVFETPVGKLVHTGDFKIDLTPTDQKVIDLEKIKKLGQEGVLALFADSTNANKSGQAVSEQVVAEMIDKLFGQIKGRIIFTTFSTLVTRIQEVVNAAEKYGRKLMIAGLSMEKTCRVAIDLGYLKVKEGTIIWPNKMKKVPPEKLVILASGSQGTENSAMSRISQGEHRLVTASKGDTIIFSSSPIPGNEYAIHKIMNALIDLGAKVIYEPLFGIHASGHANKEDQKQIISLIKPKYFIPAYGEHVMQAAHAETAKETGVLEKNIFILKNGDILEINKNKEAKISTEKASSDIVLVDGFGIGDVKSAVLNDRKILADSGIFLIIIVLNQQKTKITNLEIISRGFVFMKKSEELINETKKKINKISEKYLAAKTKEKNRNDLKTKVAQQIGDFLYTKTGRRPMILPFIIEV